MRARLSILLMISCGLVSCGRPPGFATNYAGNEQPGIAAPAAAPSPAPSAAKLQAKLSALGAREQQVSSQLDELGGQIAAAQANLSTLQSQMQVEVAQKTEQYAAEDSQYRAEQQGLSDAQAQLGAQIQNQQKSLDALDGIIKQQQAWGFDSPDLDANLALEQQQRQQLTGLQTQYRSLQQQAGQVASAQQARSRWQEGADQSSTEQQYQQQYAQAQKTVQDLSTRYQKLKEEDDQLWQSMSDTQDQIQAQTQALNVVNLNPGSLNAS